MRSHVKISELFKQPWFRSFDKTSVALTLVLVLGIVCVVIGALILARLPAEFDKLVSKETRLAEGSKALEYFQNPPAEGALQVWFFNLTNPEAFLAGQQKPVLHTVGPFTFREVRQKRVQTFENGSILVYPKTTYFYDGTASIAEDVSLDTPITILNVPLIKIYNDIDNLPHQGTIGGLITNILGLVESGKAYVTKPALELLFDGYPDPLMAVGNWTGSSQSKMGFFVGKNGTEGRPYLIDENGTILSWNGQSKLGVWNTEDANMIKGTDGSLMSNLSEDRQYVFVNDLCRSMALEKSPVASGYVEGFSAVGFDVPFSDFDDTAFCQPTSVKYYPSLMYDSDNSAQVSSGPFCLPRGLLNVSRCLGGVPIVASWPHFTSAPSEVISSVEGIYPDENIYKPHVDVEAAGLMCFIHLKGGADGGLRFMENTVLLGIPLRVSLMSQINVAIAPLPGISIFGIRTPSPTANVKPTIVPTLWINETVTIKDEFAQRLYEDVYGKKSQVKYGIIALILVGIVAIFSCVGIILWRLRRTSLFAANAEEESNTQHTTTVHHDSENSRKHSNRNNIGNGVIELSTQDLKSFS